MRKYRILPYGQQVRRTRLRAFVAYGGRYRFYTRRERTHFQAAKPRGGNAFAPFAEHEQTDGFLARRADEARAEPARQKTEFFQKIIQIGGG